MGPRPREERLWRPIIPLPCRRCPTATTHSFRNWTNAPSIFTTTSISTLTWRISTPCWKNTPTIRTGPWNSWYRTVRNNAGGVYNHDLYFRTMAPAPATAPSGALEQAVRRDFGDLSGLKSALKTAALGQFGSGWAWLVSDCDGRLSVVKTPNQDAPLPLIPLTLVDVWEHAYYLGYQNRRGDYFESWWRLVDWPQLSEAYEKLLQNRPQCAK